MKAHRCQICQTDFASAFSLRRHTFCKHGVKKLLNCSICSSKFSRDDDLLRHKNTKHGKRISCPFCGLRFTRKDNMKVHIRRQHQTTPRTDNKPLGDCRKERVKSEAETAITEHFPSCAYEQGQPVCHQVFYSSLAKLEHSELYPSQREYPTHDYCDLSHQTLYYQPTEVEMIPEWSFRGESNCSSTREWTLLQTCSADETRRSEEYYYTPEGYGYERSVCAGCGYYSSRRLGSYDYCSEWCDGADVECVCCRCPEQRAPQLSWSAVTCQARATIASGEDLSSARGGVRSALHALENIGDCYDIV